MVLNNQHTLTRRERQIMDILIARGRASASEVMAAMADAPSYSAVRATLRIMEEKGHIRHEQQGASYFYLLRHILNTFFNGSPEQVMAALLDGKPSPEELDRIAAMIERARQQGR